MMQAQRYPKDYNGILSAAPAINWATFLVTELWGHVVMKNENYYPPGCELDAIRKAAIDTCDELDGVKVRYYYKDAAEGDADRLRVGWCRRGPWSLQLRRYNGCRPEIRL